MSIVLSGRLLKLADRLIAAISALILVALPCAARARIVLDPGMQADPALRSAASELRDVTGLPVVFDAEGQSGDVVVGRGSPACRALVNSGQLSLPDSIGAEGYAIRQAGPVTVVAGADIRGDVFGTLWLAERAKLDASALRRMECVRQPAVSLRDYVDGQTNCFPPGRGLEGWLQKCLKLGVNCIQIHSNAPADLELAKRYHLDLMGGTGPFANLDVPSLVAKYGSLVSEDGVHLCPLKPEAWELHRENVRSMLARYPEMDYVRISMGELAEEYRCFGVCQGPSCRKLEPAEAQRLAVQNTWDVVVGEFDKVLLISSWGNPPEKYPLNIPAGYAFIMNNLPQRKLISTVNNTQYDFYLTCAANPIIGMANRAQDIYFEVTAEYAGAGFIPVYLGSQIRERLALGCDSANTVGATARLWEGVGLWTRDILWTRANMYALYRAAWDPYGDPYEWARDWAALTFGPDGAGELAEALCISEDLARRTFWVDGFTGEKGPAYAITRRNIITDGTHYTNWAKWPHLEAYRKCQMRGKLQRSLRSATSILELRDRMMERWHAARGKMKSARLREACDRDFESFSAIAEVLSPYQRALLLWCHTQDQGISTQDRCRAAREAAASARRAGQAWDRYRSRFDLYRDSGMTQMLSVYLRDCAALSAQPDVIAAHPGKPARLRLCAFNNAWPGGLAASVSVTPPERWTVVGDCTVKVAFGQRKVLAVDLVPPPGAPQGDATVRATLIPHNGSRARSAMGLQTVVVRAKVIERPAALAKTGIVEQPTTICPRAAQAPRIDGAIRPGEWAADAPAWVNYPLKKGLSSIDNPFAFNARWMWDEHCFYLACDITDQTPAPAQSRGSVLRSDRERLIFDLDGDRRDDFEIVLLSCPDGPVAWPRLFDGVLTSNDISARPRVEPLGHGITLAIGKRSQGPGRVVEAAIPWAILGGYRPALHAVIGFAFDCADADKPGHLLEMVQWPARPQVPDGPYLSWGRADKPTLFADLIFSE